MTLFRLLLSGFALTGLVACETAGVPQPVAGKPVQIKVSEDAGPGPELISSNRAVAVFKKLCLEQLPRFEGTERVAANEDFVQHKTFGTYYHPRDNLSVKPVHDGCSMVFQSKDTQTRIKADFAKLPKQFGQKVDINNDGIAGPALFRAFVKQQ